MSFEDYKQGISALDCEDNSAWINKISCWVEREQEYDIYIFQVIIDNDNDLKDYYDTITSAIATEFQIKLEKTIERWNIYLVFECLGKISEELKGKVEQDKYSTRKLVWDSLQKNELGDKEYLRNRLFHLSIDIDNIETVEEMSLLDKIKSIDLELFQTISNTDKEIDKLVAIYLGGNLIE